MTAPSRNILVTGATSGIGRHAALDLAARGHRVFATGRNPEALAELAASGGDNLTAFPLDVTDEASIAAARDRVHAETGGRGLDVLINNAGYGELGPTELIADADIRRQFDTNVFGLMAMIRAFIPEMRERGSGRIINVSSIGGRVSMPMFGVYSASKYAVEALSDSLRMELRPFGIRVVLIEPGPIKTAFTERAMSNGDKYRDESSPYAPVVARADKLAAMAEKSGAGPHVITRAIRRAIESRRPRARYVAPLSGALAVAFVKLMPTWLTDGLLRLATGFTRKNLGSRAGAPASSAARRAA